MKIYLALVICILICLSAGLAGSFFKPGEWYVQMQKSALTPPGWVFPVVWTLLYIMMGVALWLFWKQEGIASGKFPYILFGIQLILNAAWTWFFFGLHKPGLAFVDIVLLWIAILGTILLFWKRSATAGALLVPYFAWVSLASYLNYAFWKLNS